MDMAPISHSESHTLTTLSHWRTFVKKVSSLGTETAINGQSLSIATIVAVARLVTSRPIEDIWRANQTIRYGALAHLDHSTVEKIEEGARAISSSLEKGGIIYGEIYFLICQESKAKGLRTYEKLCRSQYWLWRERRYSDHRSRRPPKYLDPRTPEWYHQSITHNTQLYSGM